MINLDQSTYRRLFKSCNKILESEVEKINGEIFNVGSQNLSILEIANLVKNTVPKYIII